MEYDINNVINSADSFFRNHYLRETLEQLTSKSKFVCIDFNKVMMFDYELGEYILDHFEESVKCFELAVDNLKDHDSARIRIRFYNIPETSSKLIWQLRTKDVNKLAVLKGFIRKISDVMHGVSVIRYECPSCGNVMSLEQRDEEIKMPKSCSCGRKGGFKEVDRGTYDLQKAVLEEDPQQIKHTQKPRRITIVLKDDLCREEIDAILQPSSKIEIIGVIKETPVAKNSKEFKKFVEVHNIKVVDETFESLNFTEEEAQTFTTLAQTTSIFTDMTQSIFPTIHGNDLVKIAIFLQMVGAPHLYINDVLEERGTIHILLVGSPGSGKTQLLKRAIQFIPNSRFTGGRGSSGVGLVAAVVQDEELGGFTIDAGAIPMCNKSMLAIDELDKIDKRDIANMNNAMNDLKVSIDKANIHALLLTDTMILGAANPINRVFDKREAVWKQIGLPKDFMDRFDLIFPVEAMDSETTQRKVASIIFSKYKKAQMTEPKYDRNFVMRYIAYVRNKINPAPPGPEVEKYLTDNFINLMRPSKTDSEQAYFSSRLLTNIIRLSMASARARMSEYVSVEDAKVAIELLVDSLKKQDIISNHGLIDMEKLEAIVPKSKRDKQLVIKDTIIRLCDESIKGYADLQDVIKECRKSEIDDFYTEEVISMLKSRGEIFEPTNGKLKWV